MFDIGFSEVLLCAVVALLVVDPDKLPSMVRTASLWMGHFRRTFSDVKAEFEREIGVGDIQQQLHNKQLLKRLESGKQQLQALHNELRGIEHSVHRDTISTIESQIVATQAISQQAAFGDDAAVDAVREPVGEIASGDQKTPATTSA
jgi:sec-independent protein translocase protein TatB